MALALVGSGAAFERWLVELDAVSLVEAFFNFVASDATGSDAIGSVKGSDETESDATDSGAKLWLRAPTRVSDTLRDVALVSSGRVTETFCGEDLESTPELFSAPVGDSHRGAWVKTAEKAALFVVDKLRS